MGGLMMSVPPALRCVTPVHCCCCCLSLQRTTAHCSAISWLMPTCQAPQDTQRHYPPRPAQPPLYVCVCPLDPGTSATSSTPAIHPLCHAPPTTPPPNPTYIIIHTCTHTYTHLCEVKFAGVKGLNDLVHPELCGPLLAVAPLIQLSHKAIQPRNNLGGARSHIIPVQV